MKASLIFRSSLLLPLLAAMAWAQAPVQLTIPGKDNDSRKAATATMPSSLEGLGTLRTNLDVYFSMDSTDMSGLTWSRKPIELESEHLVAKESDGRRYLDFSSKGSHLTFRTDYPGRPKYTLTAWVLLPVPAENGIIWCDRGGEILAIGQKRLLHWVDMLSLIHI